MSLHKSHSTEQPQTSQFIRELRQLTGLTQEEFGKQIGVSYETVSRWENGRMQPSSLAIRQLEQLVQELFSSPDPVIRERAKKLLNQGLQGN